jgi:A/G-specific adenine glycosylase
LRDQPVIVSAPSVSNLLLDWYDDHARSMPWRVPPAERKAGTRPDPYHVWLSEVMLQQTTVAAVRGYFRRFVERWPTLTDLANAADADVMAEWAGLGYYARARNLLKGARAVLADHGGRFPASAAELRTLPGIGPYTAAAIAAIAFDEPATVVDGNVERVMSRFFAVLEPVSIAKRHVVALAETLTPQARPGDYAQAVMDLGATICTPRNPVCALCPLVHLCAAQAQGIAASLPTRLVKPAKPVRQGIVWLASTPDGALLVEDRPGKGLLGGMLGIPGTGWDGSDFGAPFDAGWTHAGEVRHTFTHFHLILTVLTVRAPHGTNPERGSFRSGIRPTDLPTLMRKAWDVASQSGAFD